MSGGEDAAEAAFAVEIGARADAAQHGRGHIAQQQSHRLFEVGEVFGDLDRDGGLSACRSAPHGEPWA